MPARGYTTVSDVEALLGATFDATQQAHCESLIEQAESAIDAHMGRAWLVGPQVDEAHFNPRRELFVRYPPVTSVEAVKGTAYLGADEETLVAGEDYEVRDLEAGLIYLVSPGSYYRIRVSYTPTATLPAFVTRAATVAVAEWMQPHLNPDTFGVESFALPDLTVRYSRNRASEGLPSAALEILDAERFRVVA